MNIEIENIDWALLRKQKEFLLNNGCDEIWGLVNLIDHIQDSAIKQGYGEIEVFGELDD